MAPTRTGGGRGVLRALALTAAVGLAAAATAAVVLSDDPQLLRLAVVGALWSFVLAAFAAPRRRPDAVEPDGEGLPPGKELELRRTYEIELEREVAARREYEMQLEVYLRRELERGLQEEVQTLREELQQLRGDLIDRLDGELRMERIETTRLIGGSLRALQDEARRLGIGLPVPAELSEPSFTVRDRPELPAAGPSPGWPTDPRATPAVSGYGAPDLRPTSHDHPGYGLLGSSDHDAPGSPAAASSYSPYPSYAEPAPEHPAPSYPPPYRAYVDPAAPAPPAPREPQQGETVPPRRHRHRDEGEDNEVMSRLLGR